MKRYSIMLFVSFITILLVLSASYSSYYTTSEVFRKSRINEAEESQGYSGNIYTDFKTISHEITNTEDLEDGTALDHAMTIFHRGIILFFIVTVIMSLYQFYPYIRKWIIQISQSYQKLFFVHYSQLKDGKKNALSLSVSV